MTATAIPAFLARARTPLPCTSQPCLFHTPDGHAAEREAPNPARVEEAKNLCLDCPLMLDCRDWARSRGETGVWGGEDDAERAASGASLRVDTYRPDCGTEAGAKWHRRNDADGKPCLRCRAAENLAHRAREEARRAGLPPKRKKAAPTPRDVAMLRVWAVAPDQRHVANALGITPRSVSSRLSRLRRKLGVTTDAELLAAARKAGLIPDATAFREAA